jgi:hypothetical protein
MYSGNAEKTTTRVKWSAADDAGELAEQVLAAGVRRQVNFPRWPPASMRGVAMVGTQPRSDRFDRFRGHHIPRRRDE